MANSKRKAVEQSARIASLQAHSARSSGKPFGKRHRAPNPRCGRGAKA